MSSRGGGGGGVGGRGEQAGGGGRVRGGGGGERGRGRGQGRGRGSGAEFGGERGGGHHDAARGRGRGGERGRGRGRGRGGLVAEGYVALPRGTGSGHGAGDGTPAEADVLSGEVETKMAVTEVREGASSSPSPSASSPAGEDEPPSRGVVAAGALPPTSSKAAVFPARPGFGTVGRRCRVRANHFVVQLADKAIYHYDELVRSHQQYLDGRSPVYDGRKGMFTAGALPFTNREFVVKIANPERGNQGEKEFKVIIKDAAKLDMYSLKQFLAGTQRELPQDTIQALDIALRECPSSRYTSISRSFFSQAFGHGGEIGSGVECWRDISATAFYKAQPVMNFALEYLNIRDASRCLYDQDRLKLKKALKGVRVVTTHRRDVSIRYKITGLTSAPLKELMFDQDGTRVSVVQYFKRQYNYSLKYINWPCLQAGSDSRPTYLPMEVCSIVEGQRYSRKLNECQVTGILRLACERPAQRESSILEITNKNNYGNDYHAKEFGIRVTNQLALVDARVLPAPRLKYHDSGREKVCNPSIGQWNMTNKRMLNGGSIKFWACLTFASRMHLDEVRMFCNNLVGVCNNIGMQINGRPCVDIRQARQDNLDASVRAIHRQSAELLSQQGVIGQQLELLVIVLPDANATVFYGRIKRLCETELGVITQCCLAKNVQKGGQQYLQNLALKINVKVVASMDWPEVSKYKCLVSSQGHREEIIADLFTEVKDSQKGLVYGGMIRDGVSEGQFSQVLLYEMDAIRKACASIEEGYLPPVTFVVVQKRHHTRLFPEDHRARDQMDRSGNILPGTVVDTKICHPSEFDFYLCSHSGIQGTSRPTHYHVLFDENNFSADALQTLTYNLCYTYARCTRSVSIVPPAYYAHLAAFRARHYLEEGLSDQGSSSASAGGGSRLQDRGVPVKPLPKVKENVKQFMFYC
uniref:Piwi domain-containing protein n=1 Tax=Oryza punctata TaxID=4537 RepID=A0A0E0KHH6_ORYPU